eukprot:XP_011680231.1 PREDICTED: regulator of nonsense transcripts 3B-like [Strongylocentrotus purpuratus]
MTREERSKKLKEARTTKVVIRCLPPALTEEEFREIVDPFPDNEYFYYVKADRSLGEHAYSRAYINFMKEEDIIPFRDTWDGHEFDNGQGLVYPAVVEFAPYQKVPKVIGKKVDARTATIEEARQLYSVVDAVRLIAYVPQGLRQCYCRRPPACQLYHPTHSAISTF